MASQMDEENPQSRIHDSSADIPSAKNTILVSAEEYDWLIEKLEEPPQEIPALRALFAEPLVWNG